MKLLSSLTMINCLCLSSGTKNCSEYYSWGPGMFEDYFMVYVVKGKGTIVVDGKSFIAAEGDSFTVFPFVTTILKADRLNPWEIKWVELNGLEAMWLINQTAFTRENPIIRNIHIDNINKLYDVIYGKNEEVYEICRTNANTYNLVSEYVEKYPCKKINTNNYATYAREYIDANYRKPNCTVKTISNYIKIDRTYLFRLFKAETGMSILEYINNCRITKACLMLSDRNISIKDVAYSVGFSDQMYFSKVFKKLSGKTPTEYRKQQLMK